jgi:hypothetical protein
MPMSDADTKPLPVDVYGRTVHIGTAWYWAKDRTGQVVGVGKFAWYVGADEATFFINGVGYRPETFVYLLAETPKFPTEHCRSQRVGT